MPAVFVHGNPETPAIWDELLANLGRSDVITLAPPGYGGRMPDGFAATTDEYRDWVAGELRRIEGPIDLVGHDWGGIHAMRIAMEQPELIRSWVTDAAGIFDPDYAWHDMARVWQTQGAGERAVSAVMALSLNARAQRYQTFGIGGGAAMKVAAAFDETMARCMLALYRSAAQPALAHCGRRLGDAAAKPGLVIFATEDAFVGGEAMQRRSADKCGASVTVLQGLGHWWMCQDPVRGATALTAFWASLQAS